MVLFIGTILSAEQGGEDKFPPSCCIFHLKLQVSNSIGTLLTMKPQGKYLPADEALLTVPLNLLEKDRKMNWHSAPLLPSC